MTDSSDEVAIATVVPDILPPTVVLEGLRDGQVLEEMGFGLRELSQLVLLHQKKGTLVVKFTIEPLPNRMVVVTDEIVLTPPKAALPQTIRYVDEAGNLKKENPDRPMLSQVRDIGSAPEAPGRDF